MSRITCSAGLVLFAAMCSVDRGWAGQPPAEPAAGALATSTWKAAESPVYCDPDDDWAKDPAVIKAGDTWYMYYTSANPWQKDGSGGKGPSRIDYATSPDGHAWTYQGLSIPQGEGDAWDAERPQAPAHPVLKDGIYYMYYAGKGPKNGVCVGYATSTDLRHWQKSPGNPVLKAGKVNDPNIYLENGVYYLFYTSGGDEVYYVTSTNLVDWSSQPVFTGAVGEGSNILKDGSTYVIYACVGWSPKGEYYKVYTSPSLAEKFVDRGRIRINTPFFAAGSLSHGDIIRAGDEYWFYFQATRDVGRRFQVGLATLPVPDAGSAGK